MRTKEISKAFTDYLKRKGLTKGSIETINVVVVIFLEWLSKEQIEPTESSYTDVLQYMKHCQKQRITQRTIQHYLNSIRHFYDYQIEEQQREDNPVASIKVQGVKRKVLYHIFSPAELHGIYNGYQDETLKGKRNKVMLGLLVYQGVKTAEIAKLEVQHIKVKEGKIEVPGSSKGERRILQLEPHQVLEFYDYINTTRKEILSKSGEKTDRLFVGIEAGNSLDGCMTRLMFWLRRKNALIVNAKQLRASVIVKWLRMYNLREVQYMAGHRYISSTESYQQSDMEGLKEEVNKFHPLG
jgi:site-specific recombinase XerD